jgi:hypothetical protein
VSLAACGSPPTPTATPVPPTAAPTNPVSSDNALATLAATVGAPQVGTMVVPEQETPNAPTPMPISIDSLYYTQTGGIAGMSLTIQLRSDGTLIRDGKTSTVSPEAVQEISALLDSIHFFDIQGIFTGPSGATDTYRYSLTVNAPNGSLTITSEDGMTPPELYQVYDAIRALNQPS